MTDGCLKINWFFSAPHTYARLGYELSEDIWLDVPLYWAVYCWSLSHWRCGLLRALCVSGLMVAWGCNSCPIRSAQLPQRRCWVSRALCWPQSKWSLRQAFLSKFFSLSQSCIYFSPFLVAFFCLASQDLSLWLIPQSHKKETSYHLFSFL